MNITLARYSAALIPSTSHTTWPRRNSGPLDETGRRIQSSRDWVTGRAVWFARQLGDCIPGSTSAASRRSARTEPAGPGKQRCSERSTGYYDDFRT